MTTTVAGRIPNELLDTQTLLEMGETLGQIVNGHWTQSNPGIDPALD